MVEDGSDIIVLSSGGVMYERGLGITRLIHPFTVLYFTLILLRPVDCEISFCRNESLFYNPPGVVILALSKEGRMGAVRAFRPDKAYFTIPGGL